MKRFNLINLKIPIALYTIIKERVLGVDFFSKNFKFFVIDFLMKNLRHIIKKL